MMRWDPTQYARYSDHRSRPFFDLVAQIGAVSPGTVVDIGCGSGELTISLAQRWPMAKLLGVDSSAEMIGRAPVHKSASFQVRAAQDVNAIGVDVLISNAALQWVPQHTELLSRWAEELNDGGWIAIQVPANFDAPSHKLMRELAASPRWRDQLHGVLRDAQAVAEPDTYLDLLTAQGLHTNVWQTQYLHVLSGADPVLEWVRGTGLRPVLHTLNRDEADEFSDEYAALLRQAYPVRSYGTVFPFLRTFVVAQKATTLS
ncbi:methyltransferase domain-containing protein [Tessaracoccus antarcticus]|nr:methyltransferase domain-containing protein [Tessaracoccus antarcticus]